MLAVALAAVGVPGSNLVLSERGKLDHRLKRDETRHLRERKRVARTDDEPLIVGSVRELGDEKGDHEITRHAVLRDQPSDVFPPLGPAVFAHEPRRMVTTDFRAVGTRRQRDVLDRTAVLTPRRLLGGRIANRRCRPRLGDPGTVLGPAVEHHTPCGRHPHPLRCPRHPLRRRPRTGRRGSRR